VDLEHTQAKLNEDGGEKLSLAGGGDEGEDLVVVGAACHVLADAGVENKQRVAEWVHRGALLDGGVRGHGLLADAVDQDVIGPEGEAENAEHFLGHCRREAECLPRRRQHGDDRLDGLLEPTIQKHVTLVKHKHLDPTQALREALRRVDVLNEPARRGDHDVDGAAVCTRETTQLGVEPLALRNYGRSAHDGFDRQADTLHQLVGLRDDLRAELASAAENERPHRVDAACKRRRCARAAQQALGGWHEEGEGLSSARLGLGEDVSPGQCVRQGAGLDGRELRHACRQQIRSQGLANAWSDHLGRVRRHERYRTAAGSGCGLACKPTALRAPK